MRLSLVIEPIIATSNFNIGGQKVKIKGKETLLIGLNRKFYVTFLS